MALPGRTYSAGNLYRYGFNGKENDNDVKGEGNQQDYGMRIYDPRLGRFLSVDPITKKYPELTPYQFASNRPIDGEDLDGKEWSKTVTYDVGKGEFNVHFHCVIKICNVSSANAQAIGEEFKKSFAAAFSGLYDEKRKIRYSASAEFQIESGDEPSGYAVVLRNGGRDAGKPFIAGVSFGTGTQENTIRALSETTDNKTGQITPRDPRNVALTIIHEDGHTAGVSHTFEDDNTADDVDLTPTTLTINGKSFTTNAVSPGADKKKIISNVMTYTETTINGVRVGDIIKDPLKLNKFSPDQAYLILQQIKKDLGTKPTNDNNKPSNSTQKNTTTNASQNN